MKLFYSAGTCSLSPHIVLRELGLPFTLVDKKRLIAEGGDFSQINSKNTVPVLELDDGQRLTEGAVIVQYLGDLRPEAGLMPPAGTFARYRQQEWLNYVATEIHKGYGPLFNTKVDAANKQPFFDALLLRLGWLDGQLAARGPFLMGAQFTAVDAYLFTVLRWAGPQHIDLARFPALSAYKVGIESRPAVQEALRAEAAGAGHPLDAAAAGKAASQAPAAGTSSVPKAAPGDGGPPA